MQQEEFSISVYCTSNGQVCTPSGHARLILPEDSIVSAYFYTGGPCSSINVDITGPISGSTGWTNVEAATTYDLGTKKLLRGTYDFYSTATGTIGGCNHGRLYNWGGKMTFKIEEAIINIKNLGAPTSPCPF